MHLYSRNCEDAGSIPPKCSYLSTKLQDIQYNKIIVMTISPCKNNCCPLTKKHHHREPSDLRYKLFHQNTKKLLKSALVLGQLEYKFWQKGQMNQSHKFLVFIAKTDNVHRIQHSPSNILNDQEVSKFINATL
jgi:hypothetical protein